MSMEYCWNDTGKGKGSYVLEETPVPVPLCRGGGGGGGDVGDVITDILSELCFSLLGKLGSVSNTHSGEWNLTINFRLEIYAKHFSVVSTSLGSNSSLAMWI
jgi:hypothetical protein